MRRPLHPGLFVVPVVVLWLTALTACDDSGASGDGAATPDLSVDVPIRDMAAPALPTVSAAVRPSPDNVLTGLVDITVGGATTVTVEYGDSAAYGRKTPALPARANTLTVPIVGLAPSSTSHFRVTAGGPAGSAETGDLTLATGALPADLPVFKVTAGGGNETHFLMVGCLRASDFAGYAVILDREGKVVWYRAGKGSSKGFLFDRLSNNHYVLYQNDLPGFNEFDLTGKLFRQLADSAAPLGTDGHDLILLPNQSITYIGIDQHTIDTRPWFDGGIVDGSEVHNTVDEVDADGGLAFHWSTFPALTPGDLTPDTTPPDPVNLDMSHGNAVALAPDGNYIYHIRAASQLVKLDRKTGAILWRLGGRRSDFTFKNDPLGGPSHGHDFHYLPSGNLLCLDNGIEHPMPQYTRAVEYQLDETARTATLVWEYRHAPDLYSPLAGGARRLPSGNTVVTFALSGYITEVDAKKNVVWEAQQQPVMVMGKPAVYIMYRSIPLPALYP